MAFIVISFVFRHSLSISLSLSCFLSSSLFSPSFLRPLSFFDHPRQRRFYPFRFQGAESGREQEHSIISYKIDFYQRCCLFADYVNALETIREEKKNTFISNDICDASHFNTAFRRPVVLHAAAAVAAVVVCCLFVNRPVFSCNKYSQCTHILILNRI